MPKRVFAVGQRMRFIYQLMEYKKKKKKKKKKHAGYFYGWKNKGWGQKGVI